MVQTGEPLVVPTHGIGGEWSPWASGMATASMPFPEGYPLESIAALLPLS